MKKAVLLSSCLLMSASAFSQGFIHTQVSKPNAHSLTKASGNHVNFSGLWTGNCGNDQESVSLKIVQDDKTIMINIPETEFSTKFYLNKVKAKSDSSPDEMTHSINHAIWMNDHTLTVADYSLSLMPSDVEKDSFGGTMTFNMGLTLSLENNRLTVEDELSDNQQESHCVLEKQG